MVIMETQNNAKLFGKIAAIMGELRTLEKTGRNQYDRYDYVTADVIAIKLGALMAKHKVVLLPSMVSVETSDYATQKGGSNFRTVVNMQMTLACGDSGATWSSLWSGEAIDRSDKSITKAATSAEKYFLLKTFLLAGGDEDDADAHSPVEAAQDAPKATPKPVDVSFDKPKPQLANATKAPDFAPLFARFQALGHELYGEQWEHVSQRNAERVSGGKTIDASTLTPEQVQILIDGMNKLKQQKQVAA